MGLAENLRTLAQAVGADIKLLTARVGNVANLTTTEKTSLVGALNEVRAQIGAAGAAINDGAASATTTYSSQKIQSQIDAAISGLVDGAPAALNTLLELANELTAQDGVVDGLVSAVANRVRVDAAQQATARDNIAAASAAGVGDTGIDFAAAYSAAKA